MFGQRAQLGPAREQSWCIWTAREAVWSVQHAPNEGRVRDELREVTMDWTLSGLTCHQKDLRIEMSK